MVRDLFATLRQEWSENASVRTGVTLIVGILWLYGLLVWHDALGERDRALDQKARQLARIEAQAAETQWPDRLKEAEGRLLRFESSVKVVDSLGQAQADLQDWLNEQARAAQLRNVAVTLAGAPPASGFGSLGQGPALSSPPSLASGPEVALRLGWVVRAKVQSDFSPVAAYDLLAMLPSGSRRVWVESMVIRLQPAPRWELQVATAYRSPNPESRK
jgi:heme exporter protein D